MDKPPYFTDAEWSQYGGSGGRAQPASATHQLRATRYDPPDEAEIPPRAWLYAGHYMRQIVSATVSPGGFGKTTLALYEAINMVVEGVRVWYISGEDAKDELDRRIAAHCRRHDVNLRKTPGQLFLDDRLSFPLVIAIASRSGQLKVNDGALKTFQNAIIADRIDAVILDPWVSFYVAPESDNGAIDTIVKRLGIVAYHANCGIEVCHHVRKLPFGQLALSVEDARGASAFINACRSARVINRMTLAEAEQAKIERDRRSAYIRVDNGKTNMRPASAATWFHLADVELANGDHVQSLVPWKLPDVIDGVTAADTDWVRDIVRLNSYRSNSRSPDWLGIPIAQRLGLNVHDAADCKRINKIIGVWLATSAFTKEKRKDENRVVREFYVPIPVPNNVIPFPGTRGADDEGDLFDPNQ
jgi:hypothetical protein